MGCVLSKDETKTDNDSNNVRHIQTSATNANNPQKGSSQKGVRDDFSDNPNPNPEEGFQDEDSQPEFMLVKPPPYSATPPENEAENPTGAAEVILDAVRKAHQEQLHSINGAFSVTHSRLD